MNKDEHIVISTRISIGTKAKKAKWIKSNSAPHKINSNKFPESMWYYCFVFFFKSMRNESLTRSQSNKETKTVLQKKCVSQQITTPCDSTLCAACVRACVWFDAWCHTQEQRFYFRLIVSKLHHKAITYNVFIMGIGQIRKRETTTEKKHAVMRKQSENVNCTRTTEVEKKSKKKRWTARRTLPEITNWKKTIQNGKKVKSW